MTRREEPVDIAIDGQHVAGTLVGPQERTDPMPGVLFVHGWGGSQAQYLARAREAAALGFLCLVFDLRGHERTKLQHETVTRADSLQDVLAAYDVLAKTRQVDRDRIALAGSSYGAYLGALATGLRPVRWLSLRAPAIYKDAGWDLPKRRLHQDPGFAAYRACAIGPADNRALDACARFDGDVLIVESEHDSIVPHPVVASYLAACANARSLTYRTIEGADHGLSQERWKQGYTAFLLRWLSEMTGSARAVPRRAAGATVRLPES